MDCSSVASKRSEKSSGVSISRFHETGDSDFSFQPVVSITTGPDLVVVSWVALGRGQLDAVHRLKPAKQEDFDSD